ncbi:hypothetical protein [Bacillus sp. Marseille-Q3570]|nr:hypothetical protein [Bacillus sp. Marseille-Q3570]
MSKIQAVFIDRDGTIGGGTEVEYPGELIPYAGVLEAIQRLKQKNEE